MKKSDLIDSLAQRQYISRKDAQSIVNTILKTLIYTMVKGEDIQLRGFGSFQVREYVSYFGKNPKTGKICLVLLTTPKRHPRGMTLAVRSSCLCTASMC